MEELPMCEWCEKNLPTDERGLCRPCREQMNRDNQIYFRFTEVIHHTTGRISYALETRKAKRAWQYKQDAGNETGRASMTRWALEQGWIADN